MIIRIAPDVTEAQKKYLKEVLKADLTLVEPEIPFFLFFHNNQLCLQKRQSREHGIVVDFLEQKKIYQRQKISVKKDLLAKAVGAESGLKVCDLTMGLASDSFKLCYFGADVTAIEENPMLVALVRDGMRRYELEQEQNVSLKILEGTFQSFLADLLPQHDVFFLDPMYEHKRTALPKKEMQYLAEVAQQTSQHMLQAVLDSCKRAKKKLVIKRAPQSEPICGTLPKRTVAGKMVRFDIYV